MTYEELILAIDDIQTSLPKCANPVLLRLIAKCIRESSNEVELSARDLAAELNLSRDAIRVAASALRSVLTVKSGSGVASRWILPAEWFSPQRSLFASIGVVEKPIKWTSNQATTGLETRPQVDEKPGHYWPGNQASGRVTRPRWPGNQATVDEKPGHSGLLTRPPLTQNQQLTGSAASIESIEKQLVPEHVREFVDRIVHVDFLQPHQRQDAEILRDMLGDYRARFGQKHHASKPADDKIVARCLTAAPIERLAETLREMATHKFVPGKSDAWFVSVFLDRIHSIPPHVTAERIKARYAKKPVRSADDFNFGPQLVNQTAAGVAAMR